MDGIDPRVTMSVPLSTPRLVARIVAVFWLAWLLTAFFR